MPFMTGRKEGANASIHVCLPLKTLMRMVVSCEADEITWMRWSLGQIREVAVPVSHKARLEESVSARPARRWTHC